MAKNVKKLVDFFGARRRSAWLVKSELLKSKGNEKRMKLHVSMPMSNTTLTDVPTDFFNQFSVMEKEDSASNRSAIDVEFNSMAVRIFSTETTTEPSFPSVQGALLHHFSMVGEGTGEKRTVSLDFLIYLPATKEMHDWEWHHTHAEFFLEAVQSQGSLDLAGEAEEEDEEERANPLATETGRSKRVTVIPPANKKNGPKELAEFHAKQKPN
jgi:hypothetical protein